MDSFREGWFSELSTMWPGQSVSLEVESVVHKETSKFQEILVLETKSYGRVLILDGVIQCTERDEFAYQEMISFLPLNAHPNPRKVLIVGGGDGGVAREVVKHPCVESVIQCEIDERVIEVSKAHLPFMSVGFESPKVKVQIDDGLAFVANHPNEFDVIITDSSDPVGPASSLFQKSFYENLWKALKPGGIICSQGESMWFNEDLIRNMLSYCRSIFPKVSYAYTLIPTYPGGEIGFLLCSKSPDTVFEEPLHRFTKDQVKQMNLRYYNSAIHGASFVLPQFLQNVIEDDDKLDNGGPNGDNKEQ